MKTVFALLAATTALGAFVVLPVTAAVCRMEAEGASCAAAVTSIAPAAGTMWLASNDEDDDDEGDCGDDDDDERDCAAGNSPAPSGTVAPPANGLFGTGKPPVVQMN